MDFAGRIKNGRRRKCNRANSIPIGVLGPSTGSSSSGTPTSATSVPQEAVILTQHPASTRSEITSGIERGLRDPLRDLPEWLEEFTENLVGDSVPEHRDASSSARELPSKPRAKVVSGKHCIFTHFVKDRNYDICFENPNYKGSLQKTHWHSRAKSGHRNRTRFTRDVTFVASSLPKDGSSDVSDNILCSSHWLRSILSITASSALLGLLYRAKTSCSGTARSFTSAPLPFRFGYSPRGRAASV